MGRRRRLFHLGLGRPDSRRSADWEIEHHLVEQTEALTEKGMELAAARLEAERRFGDLAKHRRRMVNTERRTRMVRKIREWNESFRSVAEHAVRGILRSPGLTLAVALTLGLGIGVNTVMFGVVDRILLSPPHHVASPDQVKRVLVHGFLFGQEGVLPALTYPDVQDLRSIPEFASVGAISPAREMTLGRGSGAMRVSAVKATFDFFPTLGASPRLGRFFAPDDDRIGAEGTVVLSEELWDRAFGNEDGILGRVLEIDGHSFTVIGVAPQGFTGVDLTPVDVWLPALPSQLADAGNDRFVTSRGSYWLAAVARLAEGASAEVAEDKATALHLAARAERIERGRFNQETRVLIAPVIQARGPMATATSRTALWLGGVSLIVLIVACANVANLLLIHASQRTRETAIRLSLGASRSRLLAEVILGGVLLSGIGGMAALALADGGGRIVESLILPEILWPGTVLTGRTVAMTLSLSCVAGFLAALGPALQATRPDLSRDLKEGGREGTRRRSRVRTSLMVAQAAMSVVLLVGAGLFLRSLNELQKLDLGLDVNHLILAELELHGEEIGAAERNRLYREAMVRVSQIPGVAGVAATDVPFGGRSMRGLGLPGVDSLPIPRGVGPLYFSVTPGYLETLGLAVRRGRSLQETDLQGAPHVAVVNETMARALWPEGDALGECFYLDGQEECTTVVGVVEDASVGEVVGNQWLVYYLPLSQTGYSAQGLYIRVDGDIRETVASAATLLRSMSPMVRFAAVRSLSDLLEPQLRSWTAGATLFSAFGLLALLVATVGLYSVLVFDVLQRTREIGIRTALGAEREQVLRGVLWDGGKMVALGCLMGLVGSFLVGPSLQPLLFHVQGRDPLVLTVVTLALLVVGFLSSLPPALRATWVDPLVALRQE